MRQAVDDREPAISVIIPVRDGAATLPACLAAVRGSDFGAYEVLVVDDGSTDATPEILAREPEVRVLRNARPRGAFACRNQAAELARGRILFFTDADVMLGPDTLERVEEHFAAERRGALIGIYAAGTPHDNLCTVLKNAWIRYSFLRAPAVGVGWFFSAAGAVERETWQQIGGCDPSYEVRLGGGDIELGHRLVRHGFPIALDRDMAVVHLKRFDLSGLLANDLRRGYGYLRWVLAPRDPPLSRRSFSGLRVANVPAGFGLSSALAWLLMLSVPTGLLLGAPVLGGAWLLANAPFLRHLARDHGAVTALAGLPVLFADQMAAGLGAGAGVVTGLLNRLE